MADFQSQAMGLTGLTIDGSSTAPSRTEFSQFLNDGVIDVTSRCVRLRPQDIESFTRESSEQTSNGFNPGTRSIVSVIRESGTNNQWYPCIKKPIGLQYRVTDPESLHFASKYSPVYMITQNRNVHVYPEPSADGDDTFKVLYVNYSPEESDGTALDHASTGIKWFPDDKVYLVILYASIQSLMAKLTSLNSSLPSDITLPVLPVAPSMNATTVSLPSFTAPDAFVQPVAPAGADIDFSSVPTAPTYISSVVSLGAAPTISDLSISAVPPVVPALTATTITETSITEPSFTPPVMSVPDFSDTNTWITTEEDSEMLAARVQEIQAKIGEYSARIAEAQGSFNKDNAIFQKDIQVAIQNAQLESAEDGTKLQKFASEVQQYQANVSKEVQEYQQNLAGDLQVWQAERTTDLQKYGSDVQNETARVGNDMKIYQQEITKAAQKYQAETGYDLGKYSAEVQAAVAKFTNDLQKNNTTFQGDLGKFSVDLKETQQENQEKLAIYSADVQKYSAELAGKTQEFTTSLQKDQADYQWATAQYAALKGQYDGAFALMAPPAPQQQQQRTAQRRR